MQVALAIISGLVTLAGLAYKVWSQHRSVKGLEVKLVQETKRADDALIALEQERLASKERSGHAKELEESLREHLKSCDTPLADWANDLMRIRKPSS